MKRILSLVLAMVMVLGSFSAVFAVEPTAADEAVEILMDLGVLTEGKLEQDLKRQDAVVLLSRLMGEAELAAEYPSEDLPFEDVTDSFYAGYIAWARMNKLTEGKSATKFGFGEFLKTQELAMFLLRALGYGDVEFDNALEEATTLGLLVNVDEGVTAKRGMMAVMTLNALKTNSKGTEVTLATKLGHVLPEEEVVVPATFELEGVTATNLREVDVVFNKSVDEDSLNKDNFLLGTTKATSVELLEDTKTVRAIFTMTNQTEYTLTIKTVKDVDGLEIKDATKKFTAFDTVAPLVESVEVFGNKKVVVTFTEPVGDTAKSLVNYKIDGKLFGALIKVEGRETHLELTSRLADGVHTFVVDSKVTDFAGFKVIANSNEIVVAKDDVKPAVASVGEVTQTKVVVTFTEPVESNFKVSAVVGTFVDKETTDNLTYTLNFSSTTYLPLSGTEITLTDVTDFYGNKDTLKINVVPTIDLVRPEVKAVTAPKQNEIVVEFTKPVNATTGTYTLKTVATTPAEVAVTAAYVVTTTGENVTTKVVLTKGSAFDAEDYTLEIKGVEDLTPLKNTVVPTIQNVTVADLTAPIAVSATYLPATTAAEGAIYVYFDKEVEAATALDKANYSYIANIITKDGVQPTAVVLGASHSMSLLPDGKVVKITLAKSDVSIPTLASITIANVKDLAGNKMSPVYLDTFGSTVPAAVSITNPRATAVNTIKVDVTANIDPYTLTPSDFVVRTDEATPKTIYVIDAVYTASANTITMTLSDNLSPAALYSEKAVELFVVAQNLKDIYGNKIAIVAPATEVQIGTTVADKIAPTATKIVEAKVNTGKLEILVDLSEELVAVTQLSPTNILVDVDGAMAVVEKAEFVPAVVNPATPNRLKITVNAAPVAGKLVKVSFYSNAAFADANTNLLKNFNFEIKSLFGSAAPAVNKAALTAALATAATKVEADYTTESWAAFQAALTAAKDLPETTQAEVDAKLAAVEAAVDELVVKPVVGPVLKAVKVMVLGTEMVEYTVTAVNGLDGAAKYSVITTVEGVENPEPTPVDIGTKITDEISDGNTVTIKVYAADGTTVLETYEDFAVIYTTP